MAMVAHGDLERLQAEKGTFSETSSPTDKGALRVPPGSFSGVVDVGWLVATALRVLRRRT
jgi:hypothetical protein